MASNVFGAKQFKPTAPDKGSFPLDHEGECKVNTIITLVKTDHVTRILASDWSILVHRLQVLDR